MTTREAYSISKGDKVIWKDPDAGLGTREFIVSRVEVHRDRGFVEIEDRDGSFLQAPARELAWATDHK